MDRTIIYYSSNRENEKFERKIIDSLVKQAKDIPIISVTQKPLNLGKNICVGEHEQSYANALLQLKIGIEATDSPYILVAESDCLYPPDYFTFLPMNNHIAYFYEPVWILQEWIGKNFGSGFRKKTLCEGAMMAHRRHLLYRIKRARRLLQDRWVSQTESVEKLQPMFWQHAYRNPRYGEQPMISFKTEQGVNQAIKDMGINNIPELPYWGNAEQLRKDFCEV